MKLNIIGDNSNISRIETTTLVNFLMVELFTGKIKINKIHEINIDYRQARYLEQGGGSLAGVTGFMQHDETNLGFDIHIWIRPEMARVETIKTFCHEFVHVEQQVIDNADEKTDYTISYENDPWENEAFALENGLYNKYVGSHTIESVHQHWLIILLQRLLGWLFRK